MGSNRHKGQQGQQRTNGTSIRGGYNAQEQIRAPRRASSGTNERDSERLSFGSLFGALGTHSSARNSRVRELIPLTPEILHLLDRLEPDKGKQARLLTDLTLEEAELQTHLERRAARDIKRQQVAAEAAAKAAADQDKADHETSLAAHVGHQAMATKR